MFSGKLFTITSAVLTIVSAVHAELAKPEEHVRNARCCPLDVDGGEVWIPTVLFLSNCWDIAQLATRTTTVMRRTPHAAWIGRSTIIRARF